MKRLILILSTLAIQACGGSDKGGGGSSAGSCGSKPLFSVWQQVNLNFQIDLTNAKFGQTQTIQTLVNPGVLCESDLFIEGSECSGLAGISNSRLISGSGFNCSLLDDAISYGKSSTGLSICYNFSQSCEFFQ